MTQSSYPFDYDNFLSPQDDGALAVSLICTTALERLDAVALNDVKLQLAKNFAIKALRLLRLACQKFQRDQGFVAMK